MNDEAINQYINKLPKPVKNMVMDGAWEDRVFEIAKKYSLTDSQTDYLANDTLLVLIGLEKPETFLETITTDLSISRLLSEQIFEDLENRVFEYALKLVEEKTNVSQTSTSSTIPEIKPDNLPAVEIGQESKPYSPVKSSEVVQKPYSVPRFGMKDLQPKIPVINLSQNKPSTGQGAMESKLNSVTTNIPLDMQKKNTPTEQGENTPNLPRTKYDSDPYREPLV